MNTDRYAAFEQATGGKLVKAGDMWWRQVRPLFYRPLLPFKKHDLKETMRGVHRIGAFQHGVLDGQSSNSYLNPIVFDELGTYDMKNLRKNVRSQVKKALQSDISVRRIIDEGELAEKGHSVYLSFLERTKYSFDSNRRQKEGFARWVHTILQFPEAVVLGSFAGEEMLSFEISCLVEGAVILKTIVNSDRALKLYVPDLLLHHTRISARQQSEIELIYDSMLTHSAGINEFKILRGGKVVALPAFLHLNAATVWLIKRSSKSAYDKLRGFGHDELVASGLAAAH
ncbi:MAG TPA: hypothetical protein VH583_22390 [Vicinamibacterales bacterium]|jgi:hypothetical protein